jgi:FeS assembly protein IscX
MPKLSWNDPESIGIALFGRFPDVDPLMVRFTDLHRWVVELADFNDDPKASSEGKLEAIQMAWHEEWSDNQ